MTFTVPSTPTVPLFYQCGVHSFMTNTITLTAAPPTVPAVGTWLLQALGTTLCAAGVLVFRKREATLRATK